MKRIDARRYEHEVEIHAVTLQCVKTISGSCTSNSGRQATVPCDGAAAVGRRTGVQPIPSGYCMLFDGVVDLTFPARE